MFSTYWLFLVDVHGSTYKQNSRFVRRVKATKNKGEMGNGYHKGDSEVKKNMLLQNVSVIFDQFEKI